MYLPTDTLLVFAVYGLLGFLVLFLGFWVLLFGLVFFKFQEMKRAKYI